MKRLTTLNASDTSDISDTSYSPKIKHYLEGEEYNIGGGVKNKKQYTVVDFPKIGNIFGNFESSEPLLAASQALTKLAKMTNVSNETKNNFIIFTIKELKKKQNTVNNNLYTYIGTRVK